MTQLSWLNFYEILENIMLQSIEIYYGMYYALTALALKNEYETSKHSKLIGWFNKEFVATEIVVDEMIEGMKFFIKSIESILDNNNKQF